MNALHKSWNDLLMELRRFSPKIVSFGPPIIDDRLEVFEKAVGFELPFEFKWWMKWHNGFGLGGTEINGLDQSLRGASLDELYRFEHFEAGNPMPLYFLPFSPDGRGNHYCLNLSKRSGECCPVVFWQHDLDYDTHNVEECNPDLSSWIKEVMIDWTLEYMDYDGGDKDDAPASK